MRSITSDRIALALLAEMSNGSWTPGMRFLSHRQIKRYWRISTASTCMSLETLLKWGLLKKRDRSGHYLAPDFRSKALSILDESPLKPLPRQARWQSRLWSTTAMPERHHRIAVILVLNESHIIKQFGDCEQDRQSHMSDCVATAITVKGIVRAARFTKTQVDLYAYDGSATSRKEITQRVLGTGVQGVIIVRRVMETGIAPLATTFLRKGLPVVTAYDDCEKIDMMPVNFNNVGIGQTAARVFMRNGHRHIGVLMLKGSGEYFEDRLRGCQAAVDESLLEPKTTITPLWFDSENPEEVATVLAKLQGPQAPTALLATHTFVLTALADGLKAQGKLIPRDLSVIVCSSTPEVNGFNFPVDMMRLDFQKVGITAFRTLVNLINGRNASSYSLVRVAYQAHGTTAAAPDTSANAAISAKGVAASGTKKAHPRRNKQQECAPASNT